MTTIIASFSCHKGDSTTHTLSVTDGVYKHEKVWFNTSCHSDKVYQSHMSKVFERAHKSFLISADVSLDSSKSYNDDITDEQKLKIRDAVNDSKEYGEYLEVDS